VDRRKASSALNEELFRMAAEAGVKPGQIANEYEAIEGSDTLQMVNIQVAFEGSYQNLTRLVDLIDKSPRFLMIESLQTAAPQGLGAHGGPVQDPHVCARRAGGCAVRPAWKNKRKVAALAVLGLVAAYFFYANVLAPQGGTPTSGGAAAASAPEEHRTDAGAAHPAVARRQPSDRRAWQRGRPGRRSATGTKSSTRCCIPRIRRSRSIPTQWIPDSGSTCWPNCRAWRRPAVAQPFSDRPGAATEAERAGADHQAEQAAARPPDVFHTDPVVAQGPPPLPPITFQVLWAHHDSKER